MRIVTIILTLLCLNITNAEIFSRENNEAMSIQLPKIKISLSKPFSRLLQERQSVRKFKSKKLSKNQISALLWAAIGKKVDAISSASRTVPSAGARYPIEVYLYIKDTGVKDLEPGLYHYFSDAHSLSLLPGVIEGRKIISSCWDQGFILAAPVVVIVAANFEKTTSHYGKRGERYVYIDAGHVAQNLYLMATQLGLATVEVGAFDDFKLAECLKLPKPLKPILIMPVGYEK